MSTGDKVHSVKIRARERSCASPPDGLSPAWVEYQVIVRRKIVSRHDTEDDAKQAVRDLLA